MRILDGRSCTTVKQLNKLVDNSALANPVYFYKYLPDKILITEKLKDAIRHYYNMQTDDWDAPLEFRAIPCEVKDVD